MAGPRARLAILVVVLLAGFTVFFVVGAIDTDAVRDWVDRFGPAAPVVYVVTSAALGMIFVPGPVLGGVSGLLFGTALGTVVTLCSAVLAAVGGLLVARRVGRAGVKDIAGDRLDATERLLERHGMWAVVGQRLMPGVPDSPMNYAAGLVGITVAQIALGTLIGAAPRALSYTMIGANVDDPTSTPVIVATVILVVVAIVGAEIGRRAYLGRRRVLGGAGGGEDGAGGAAESSPLADDRGVDRRPARVPEGAAHDDVAAGEARGEVGDPAAE